MNIIKTLMITISAGLIALPVYAHQGNYDGASRLNHATHHKSGGKSVARKDQLTRKKVNKRGNHHNGIAAGTTKFKTHRALHAYETARLEKKLDRARDKIYSLKHDKYHKYDHGRHYGWYKKPYYSYRDHGHRHGNVGNDRWTVVLKLSDYF